MTSFEQNLQLLARTHNRAFAESFAKHPNRKGVESALGYWARGVRESNEKLRAHGLKALFELIGAKSAPAPSDVVHPVHYNKGKIEVWDALDDWGLEALEWQACKYIARAQHKGHRIADLKKAVQYLQRKIARLEGQARLARAKDKRKGGRDGV